MKKAKIIYITLIMMVFSFTTVQASEIIELKLEDAIIMAQKRDKKLRMQQTTIELAEVNTEGAKENYYNSWDIGFEQASASYSQARANEEYEKKSEAIIAEEVAYKIEKQFDEILELEERHELAVESLEIQKQKAGHSVKREQLGLGSKAATKAERAKVEMQKKEIESLIQALDGEYRELNHLIGSNDKRYNLIKENIYTPLDMKRSIQGQVSYAINSDPGFKLQEEIAKSQEITFAGPGPDGYAPTYTLYQQRKLNYQQAMNNLSLSKEGKEIQIKQMYENIVALEIQHDKMLLDLEETQRQYEIMTKRYELGMITHLNLQELELALLQNKTQISSTIRQHNQLKILFEKSYLGTGQMK